MAAMRGINSFLVIRYVVFGLFTICNAITCSVAVWNYSLVLYTQSARVDIYLIFLGAFSLLSIFTFIFVELLCVNALTTRVWFECAWVTLFWLMQLAGGAALIGIESYITCSAPTATFLDPVCTSECVLLAFTWMCTATLLVYLLTLVSIIASQCGEDTKIWVSDIRGLRTVTVRRVGSSAPSSPLTTRYKYRAGVDVKTPHPTRSRLSRSFSRFAGLSSQYEIEPFRPVFASPEQMDIPHSSDLPEAIALPPDPTVSSYTKPVSTSLSPNRYDTRPEPVSLVEYPRSGRPPGPMPGQSASAPYTSPLGDWPRQDVMQLPTKSKRKAPPPPSAFEFPRQPHQAIAPSTDGIAVPVDTVVQPRPRRPSGPRPRAPSGDGESRLVVPLELYGIRNFLLE